jgi:hypothetical protein
MNTLKKLFAMFCFRKVFLSDGGDNYSLFKARQPGLFLQIRF